MFIKGMQLVSLENKKNVVSGFVIPLLRVVIGFQVG